MWNNHYTQNKTTSLTIQCRSKNQQICFAFFKTVQENFSKNLVFVFFWLRLWRLILNLSNQSVLLSIKLWLFCAALLTAISQTEKLKKNWNKMSGDHPNWLIFSLLPCYSHEMGMLKLIQAHTKQKKLSTKLVPKMQKNLKFLHLDFQSVIRKLRKLMQVLNAN